MPIPDYQGGGIVNLMASIAAATGAGGTEYPEADLLSADALRERRNIVLLVIDGLGHDYLLRAADGGAMHAHLLGRLTSVFPATTASAITTFLTGTAPKQHALTGWFVYVDEADTVTSVPPLRVRPDGRPLRELGYAPRRLLDQVPLFDRMQVPSYVVAPAHIVDSDFNTTYSGRARRCAYRNRRELFERIGAVVRADGGRKYVYAYWPELDGIAHEYGAESRRARDHLAELDAEFERLLEAIRGTDTTLVLTADHGTIDSGPERLIELDDHPRLAAMLRLPLCGDRRVAYCYVEHGLRERFERYVVEVLGERVTLHRSRALVEDGYYGLGTAHPKLASRIGDYTLISKANYAIKDWLAGERRFRQIGVHGGLSTEEMYVPLVVARV